MALGLRHLISCILCFTPVTAIVATCDAVLAQEQKAIFVPPPRTVADITAILDQEKPDPNKAAKAARRSGRQAACPTAARAALAKFHDGRCTARGTLGELRAPRWRIARRRSSSAGARWISSIWADCAKASPSSTCSAGDPGKPWRSRCRWFANLVDSAAEAGSSTTTSAFRTPTFSSVISPRRRAT